MDIKTPKKLLTNKARRDMWKSVRPRLKNVCESLHASEVFVFGSFSSKKRRPADIDVAVVVKGVSGAFPLDIVLIPEGRKGKVILDDMRKWMTQKYGAKKFSMLKIK